MIMLFDSHCHLNTDEFKNNYKEIITDCLEKEIGLVNIGADFLSSKRAVEIANEYRDKPIYASIGMHPESLNENFDQEKFQNLIINKTTSNLSSRRPARHASQGDAGGKSGSSLLDKTLDSRLRGNDKKNIFENYFGKKIIAVGEIGLEYFFDDNEELKEKQKQLFIEQLNFAIKNNLPVILHARGSKENPDDAYEDVLTIINQLPVTNYQLPITGVVHCFSASLEIAQKFLDLGFYIGLTGLITFKNKSVDSLRQTAKMIPLERILVETDAPCMTPEPHRGELNVPLYVEFVAKKIAEIKEVSYEEVCKITTENFKKLFLK